MSKLQISALCVSFLILTSCTTARLQPYQSENKVFSSFLAGSYASRIKESQFRSDYLTTAFRYSDYEVSLGQKAISSAIVANNLPLAHQHAEIINIKDKNDPLSNFVLGQQTFSQGLHETAVQYLTHEANEVTISIVMGLLAGWNYVALNDIDKAREEFLSLEGGVYFQNLGQLQIAKAEGLIGDSDLALEAFKLVEDSGQLQTEYILSKARFLSSINRNKDALLELEHYSNKNNLRGGGPVESYIKLLKSQKLSNIRLTAVQEAARSLTEPSYWFFVANRSSDAGEILLRLALDLDPSHDKAAIWLGELLENTRRPSEALDLYLSVPNKSIYNISAKLAAANLYLNKKSDLKAFNILQKLNTDKSMAVTMEALGRAYIIRENYIKALPIYNDLILKMTDQELKANLQPLYFRGICYERVGKWDKAEDDFKKVLSINPNYADALNYLGYTWIDRGEYLSESLEMIQKAVELSPNNGAIIDSLGWAYYKLGDLKKAKLHLEVAVEMSPTSATIIDHLGDVYWVTERKKEAMYQWERALNYNPTTKEKNYIVEKLKGQFQYQNQALELNHSGE